MKQFVAWARVSSLRQKKEGFSLEDQEARLHEFAVRLGGVIAKLYKVAETASKHEERATFHEFTAYVKRHARSLSGMLFVKVDRAARSIQSWAELESLAEATHVPLFFPDQPTGETPAGRMQRRMSAVFASYQTDQQATDIRAGHKRRVESGLPLGRQYGYRNVRTNGRSLLELDPLHAPKVRRVFELFAYQPHTLASLIDALARQGVVYTDRHPRFDKSVLYRLLTNRHYLGEVRYRGHWSPGSFEPLVDRATFQTVQDRFMGRIFRKPQITFAGELIRCGHCGHVITGEKKLKTSPNGRVREYSYYRCTKYSTQGHPRIRVPESTINAAFVDVFSRLRIDDPEVREWIKAVIRAKAAVGRQDNEAHRTELQRQETQVAAKLKTLLDLRMEGEIGSEEYAAKRAELHERQAAIQLQLETTTRDDREIADLALRVFELSQSLKTRWENADYAAKRGILELLGESVCLNSQNLEIRLKKPFDLIANQFPGSLNGAGGNRTPVPKQSAECLYACVWWFDLDPPGCHQQHSVGSSAQCYLAGAAASGQRRPARCVVPRAIGRHAGDVRPLLGRKSVVAVGN